MAETGAGVGYRRAQTRAGRVPISTKIFQGLGALPGGHKDFAFNTFLLLYYNQILGVQATGVSLVLATALIVDAISDPLVGAYSDQLRSRLGRRHPLMYAAAIPLGILVYLVFSPPTGASEAYLIGWLFVTIIGVHLAFTFFVVPWNALAAEYSDDYVERTSIINFRVLVGWVFGAPIAFMFLTFAFAGTQEQPVGQLNPDNYPAFALAVSVLIATWCLLTTHLTKREVPYLLQPIGEAPRATLGQLLRTIVLAFRSKNFRLIVTGHLIYAGVAGVGGVFDIYMNTFFWEFAAEDLRWFVLAGMGAILAFLTIGFLQARFQKHYIVMASIFATIVLAWAKVIFRFADIWPPNGDPSLLAALVTHGILMVYVLTVGGIMFASMIADMVDEQELEEGVRQEGVYASSLSFTAKAVSSIGLVAGGVLLDYIIMFPRGGEPGAIAPDTLFRLAVTDGIAVPFFLVIPAYLLSRYTLTLGALTTVQARLAERREARSGIP